MSNKQVKNTSPTRERASAPGVRASVTIEAAFAVPLFMFAVLSLIFLIEIQSIRGCIHAAGSDAAKQAAESTAVLPVLNTIQLKSDLVNLIGEERIERSILNGGTSAISCWKSYWIPGTEEINVVIEYKIKIPVPLLKSPSVKLKDEFKVSAWNGYQKDRKGNEDGQIVYITEKGTVWHSDYQCSYLQLSIQYVQYSELQNMRNEGGGKYHKCEQCVYGQAMNGVYITSYGNRYHNSLNCSSLKRTIRAVHKSEVAGRGGCSNVQNNECIRAKWKGKSMDVFSSCYSSVSVDFVCDRYSLEESKCKKSFDFACDCSFMSGTMQQRRTQDDGSRWIVWRGISFFKLVHTRVIWLRR